VLVVLTTPPLIAAAGLVAKAVKASSSKHAEFRRGNFVSAQDVLAELKD
jgi:hypothetical protein